MPSLFLHDAVCAYFQPKTPAPLNNTKKVPLREITKLLSNIHTIDLRKASEVLLQVIFKNIKPHSGFNLLAEIQNINSYPKTNLYNKLYLRKVCLTVSTMKDRSGLARGAGELEDEDLVKNLHSRYLASMILFHDRCIFLTMKEAIGMASISQFVEDLLEGAQSEDYNNLAYLMSEASLRKIPLIKQILRDSEDEDEENKINDTDSLFNFSVDGENHSPKIVGGFSFLNSLSEPYF